MVQVFRQRMEMREAYRGFDDCGRKKSFDRTRDSSELCIAFRVVLIAVQLVEKKARCRCEGSAGEHVAIRARKAARLQRLDGQHCVSQPRLR
jgi:hypothetical protein